MYPHRIRLRTPWETDDGRRVAVPSRLRDIGASAGVVRLQRKFGYPGRIDDFERVWLTFDHLEGSAEVILNGRSLGNELSERFELEVTSLLHARNNMEVILKADSELCGITGEVALEIRCAVYLRDVHASKSSLGDLSVRGRLLGRWDGPLDLYVLIDGRNAGYQSLRAEGEPMAFEIVVPASEASGQSIRVDLVQGALVWYREDLSHPARSRSAADSEPS